MNNPRSQNMKAHLTFSSKQMQSFGFVTLGDLFSFPMMHVNTAVNRRASSLEQFLSHDPPMISANRVTGFGGSSPAWVWVVVVIFVFGREYQSVFIQSGDSRVQGEGLASGHRAGEVGACTVWEEGLQGSWKQGSSDWEWGMEPCSAGRGSAHSIGRHTPHPAAEPDASLSVFGCRTTHVPPVENSMSVEIQNTNYIHSRNMLHFCTYISLQAQVV